MFFDCAASTQGVDTAEDEMSLSGTARPFPSMKRLFEVEMGKCDRRPIRPTPAMTSESTLSDLNRKFDALYLMLG